MAWTVRPATRDDLDLMVQIEVDADQRFREVDMEAIADAPPPDAGPFAAHISAGTAWVAVVDGEVVGFATAAVVDSEGHLDQVSVSRAAGGQGVGADLVRRVHSWARDAGFGAITLTTFTDVAWNAPYYERLGYRRLTPDEMGPELATLHAAQCAAGLDPSPRTAMRHRLA